MSRTGMIWNDWLGLKRVSYFGSRPEHARGYFDHVPFILLLVLLNLILLKVCHSQVTLVSF